jgi:hypothetical protein
VTQNADTGRVIGPTSKPLVIDIPTWIERRAGERDGWMPELSIIPVYDRSFDGEHFELVGIRFQCVNCGHEGDRTDVIGHIYAHRPIP